jgi:hypothetical protein
MKELSLMSQKYFDDGAFKTNTFFIDAAGFRYDLKDVEKVRDSRNPLRWFRPSRAIVVNVELESPTPITLDAAKELLTDLVVRNLWYRQGSQSEPKFRKMINQAESFRGLIDLISFYGDWQG